MFQLPGKCYPSWCVGMGISLVCCSSPSTPQITPVDPELNHALLTGEGMDTRLFSSTQCVQYYEVDHLDARAPEATQAALDQFIRRQYTRADLMRWQQFTLLFYHPTFLVNYRAEAYEAAREDEVGFLTEHHDALAAQVRLQKLPGPGPRWLRSRVLYYAQAVQRSATDTVRTDQLFTH